VNPPDDAPHDDVAPSARTRLDELSRLVPTRPSAALRARVAAALAEPEQPAQANTGELARQLLAAGADVDTVAKATGLPPTTVAALANAVKAG